MTDAPRPPGDSNEPSSSPPPPPAAPPPPPSAPPPPPAAGYPPAGGYAAGPPAGFATNDEKTWALVAHFGGALGMFLGAGAGGWLAPLIAFLAKGNESPTVRAHAVAALNFQLLWSIIGIVGWATVCIGIGFILWIGAMIIGIVFGVIAGMKANEGQLYSYPMTVTMVK
ncbi:MAG TPA: DUF4870 domain-containing protein [Micromonosporaceae bacterium]|nr:DUF4870 domain-containing protein [Micromonosporaceae bacterium]